MTLVHLTRQPAVPSARPPLLLLLHGIGSDEEDLFALRARLDGRFLVVSARAPFEYEPMGYAWYDIDYRARPPTMQPAQAEESREALARFVAELCDGGGADPARIFVMGFSQGAVMALGLAVTHPELVAGVVAHSGRLLPQFLSRAAPPDALAALHALVLHGTEDDVVPVERGREARDLLAPLLDGRLEYREYPLAHGISERSLADAAAWLSGRLDRVSSRPTSGS